MNTNRKTVLVVDDTPANIQLVSGLLRELYKVKAATSGEKALKIANLDPPPDLILLDVMMPEIDGYEVCRRLKGHSATQAIPVIFLTGNDDESERQTGLALGAVDYISKPVDPDDLVARVENWIAG